MRETADRHPEAGRIELWFMDEARVGQKGRLTHVWYQKGVRPVVIGTATMARLPARYSRAKSWAALTTGQDFLWPV